MIPKSTNKKYFVSLKKKPINEYAEQASQYAFWGWIVPAADRMRVPVDDMLISSSGERGSGPVYIITEEQASAFDRNYTHSTLTMTSIGTGYQGAFDRGWFRFAVEEAYSGSALKIYCSRVDESTLKEGVAAIHSICKGSASNNPVVVEDMTRTFGWQYSKNSEYKKIRLLIRDSKMIRVAKTTNDEALQDYYDPIESAIGISARDVPELLRQVKLVYSKLKA